nr:PREDICTED: spermatid perinuclear RNA-binding protein-like [Paralichthys olivaceus]
MCNTLPVWQPLKGWPLELICEKAIATCNRPLGPGEALRRVMECVASGILLPGGPGVHDPCEREPTDVLSDLSAQQADAVTHSSQVSPSTEQLILPIRHLCCRQHHNFIIIL